MQDFEWAQYIPRSGQILPIFADCRFPYPQSLEGIRVTMVGKNSWRLSWLLGLLILGLSGLNACSSSATSEEGSEDVELSGTESEGESGDAGTDAVSENSGDNSAQETVSESTEKPSGSESTDGATQEVANVEQPAQEVATNEDSGTEVSSVFPKKAQTPWKGNSTGISPRETPAQVDGQWVNSYGFVRGAGQTWIDLAQKIYGNPAMAEKLQKWNPGVKPVAGTLVYYNSPSRPTDSSQMKSLVEDFGFAYESHKIQPGESLSGIAKARFGCADCWKEILAANPGLKSADQISPGSLIRIAPVKLNTEAVITELASARLENERQAALAARAAEEKIAAERTRVAAAEQASEVQAGEPAREPAQASATQTAEENAQAVGGDLMSQLKDPKILGAGGLALVGLAWMIQRRRRLAQDE